MNLKKFVNISRVIDVYLIPSLSNIILDYMICDSGCFNCPHKYNHINDYPYFRILSVKIRNKIPEYTEGIFCQCGDTIFNSEIIEIIKNKNELVEFRDKYGAKDKKFYDKSRELIYYSHTYPDGDRVWFSNCNIFKHIETKEIYNKCISGEKKRLGSYKDKIGKIMKNKYLHKYFPFDPDSENTSQIGIFPESRILTEEDIYQPGDETIVYQLKKKKKNIFKFVGMIIPISIPDLSEIVVEGIL